MKFGSVLLGLSLLSSAAFAQQKQGSVDTVNCGYFKGKAEACLVNRTDFQVTDITCEGTGGMFGSRDHDLGMPKGGVAPHSLTIVNFNECHTALVFSLLGQGERRLPNVNTKAMTLIEVPTH